MSAVGFNLCFFPMHYFGLCGLPRRVCVYESGFSFISGICTLGRLISALRAFLFIFILWESVSVKKIKIGRWGVGSVQTSLMHVPVSYHANYTSGVVW